MGLFPASLKVNWTPYGLLQCLFQDEQHWGRLFTEEYMSIYTKRPGFARETIEGILRIRDGVTAPTAESNYALIYVDQADGDLKVRFSDGTTKTISTDT